MSLTDISKCIGNFGADKVCVNYQDKFCLHRLQVLSPTSSQTHNILSEWLKKSTSILLNCNYKPTELKGGKVEVTRIFSCVLEYVLVLCVFKMQVNM